MVILCYFPALTFIQPMGSYVTHLVPSLIGLRDLDLGSVAVSKLLNISGPHCSTSKKAHLFWLPGRWRATQGMLWPVICLHLSVHQNFSISAGKNFPKLLLLLLFYYKYPRAFCAKAYIKWTQIFAETSDIFSTRHLRIHFPQFFSLGPFKRNKKRSLFLLIFLHRGHWMD